MQVLIIEDQPSDLQIAAKTAESCGFSAFESRSSVGAARLYLEKCLEGAEPLPDAILLDIDLGYESGFELLRFWHGDARLSQVPLVVWTILGDRYRHICKMFHVTAYVDKAEDVSLLRDALSGLKKAGS